MPRAILLALLIGVLILGAFKWRDLSPHRRTAEARGPSITKQPVNFTSRTFDPTAPPADMPPLTPGENAECESEFLSNASVGGDTRHLDATHANLTITQVKMTLQLNITIWTPAGVSDHVMDHEEGHRQISEYYYQSADKLAVRIAASYIGKQISIEGADLDPESQKQLQQMAAEITEEYDTELNTEPAQLLFDSITDHSRNQVVVKDAVAHALKNVAVEYAPASSSQ